MIETIHSSMFTSGSVALFTWAAAERCPILSVTPNIQQILGYSQAELSANRALYGELIHPDDRDAVYEHVDKNLRANIDEFARLDYRLIKKDGTVIWVEDHTVVIRDPVGIPTQYIGYIIDVTERHLAKEALRVNKERIEALTNLMSDWAWEVNSHGVYTYCSDRVEQFLGYRADEIIGKTPFDLMPQDEADRVGAMFGDILARQAPIQNLENWNLAKDGQRVCLLTNGIPLLSDTGELLGYRGVDTDITERKTNEQLLRRAHTAAVETLRVKNEFLANISHELRTPLNGINGALQLLLDSGLTAEQSHFASIADTSCQQLIELVNNLLNYSSIQNGRISLHKKPTAIRELVNAHFQATQLLTRAARVQLALNIAEDVPDEIMTDPIWLKQVLSNLIGNAIKFTPAGTISIDVKRLGERDILRFDVSDTGIGIAAEKCARVFEAFYQVDSGTTRKFDGAGLGLAICKDVVGHLGGEIGVQSQPNIGTRIWFTLPLNENPSGPD